MIASLRDRYAVIDRVIVACLARENVSRNFEPLRLIQRARRNRDPIAALFFEKQARSTFAAKAAPKSGDAAIPFETLRLNEDEGFPPARSGGYKVTARSPALHAMASDHVAKPAPYLISNATALTSPGDCSSHDMGLTGKCLERLHTGLLRRRRASYFGMSFAASLAAFA